MLTLRQNEMPHPLLYPFQALNLVTIVFSLLAFDIQNLNLYKQSKLVEFLNFPSVIPTLSLILNCYWFLFYCNFLLFPFQLVSKHFLLELVPDLFEVCLVLNMTVLFLASFPTETNREGIYI
jgi:hypothetical protein